MSLGVSVVLVSFNTKKLTLDCLHSLFGDLSEISNQVIVVDNASSDGSPQAIRNAFPNVTLLEMDKNLGFGAGNNIAFEHCIYPYVLLLNTDTVVKAGAVVAMMNILEAHADCGAVGCRLVNADGSLQRSCWSFPSPLLAWSEALGLNRVGLSRDWHRWNHKELAAVDFVIGAALMVRKSVIDQVGGFDPAFFLYAEEADWQRRMHDSGWKVFFTPAGTIVHYGGASGVGLGDRQLVESCRGTARYIRKHYGRLGLAVFRIGVICGTSLRLAFHLARATFSSRSPKLRTTQKTLLWWCGLGPREGIWEFSSGKSDAR